MHPDRRWCILYAHPRPGGVAYAQMSKYWKRVAHALQVRHINRCDAVQYPFHVTLSPWMQLTAVDAKAQFDSARRWFTPLFSSATEPVHLFHAREFVTDPAHGRVAIKLHAPHIQACVRLLFEKDAQHVRDDVILTLASNVGSTGDFAWLEQTARKYLTLDVWRPEDWCIVMWSAPSLDTPAQLHLCGVVAQQPRTTSEQKESVHHTNTVSTKCIRFCSRHLPDGQTTDAKATDADLNLNDPGYLYRFHVSRFQNSIV